MKKTIRAILLVCLFAVSSVSASAKDRWDVGTVDTAFKLIGPNHKVAVEAFRDPDFPSIVCYVSYAKAGGVSGAFGMAEDPARFSLSIVRTDREPITLTKKTMRKRQVFSSRSAIFRTMKVERFYDETGNSLIYVAYSTKLLDGSPFNSIAVIPLLDDAD